MLPPPQMPALSYTEVWKQVFKATPQQAFCRTAPPPCPILTGEENMQYNLSCQIFF